MATASRGQAAILHVDLPSQPLATALQALGSQTGTNVLFDPPLVEGRNAPALRADMTLEQAFTHLLAGTGLSHRFLDETTVIAGVVPPATLVAQTTPIPPAPTDTTQKTSAAKSQVAAGDILEEVIVSARRKDEVLTEVPASITAYSSDFLDKQNIQNFADYATKIPNMTFQYGQGSDFSSTGFSGGRQTTIRGVAGTNTTSYYLNDTPIPSTVSPQTLGLDRIEVLKGPQGTLFGASSMGGNLRFITRKPSLTQNNYTAEVQGGYTQSAGADYAANGLAGVVLIPDVMALDVALGYTHESGFITRRFPDASGNPVSKDDQGRSDTISGSATLRAQVTDDLELTFNLLGSIYNLMGYPAAYVPLPAYRPLSYTVDRDHDVQEYSKDRWLLSSIAINYTGSGYSVVSSTSYFARRVKEREDATEGTNTFIENVLGITDLGDPAFPALNVVTNRRITHETRVSFDEGRLIPKLSGIAGIFLQRETQVFNQPAIIVPELAAYGPPYLSNFRFPSYLDNGAVFGELYYEVVPKLTVTLGLRQYWVKQKNDGFPSSGFFSSPEGDYTPASNAHQSGLVPKAVVSYKIGDSGNVYASAAKGFRPGGAQPALTDDFCVPELTELDLTKKDVESYQPDTLWSYEVGAKSKLADSRITLSSALFQINWSNMQQSILLSNCGNQFTTNAGKARIRGGELEISGQPLDSVPFTVQFGLGYTDGVLLEPGKLQQDANTRLAQTPELTGSVSGYYETPISPTLNLFVAADYAYTGSVKAANGPDAFVTRRPFSILNGNVGLRFGQSELLVYGKNLLDKRLNFGDLYTNGFERSEIVNGNEQRLPRAAVSRPRQIGMQYRVNF